VTAPQAHNVTNDQVAYGRLGAEWLFKQLGGKGNVVEMRGIAGVPADTDRHTGFSRRSRSTRASRS
jgi:ribose transport system substrate-binding protein